MVSLYVVLSLFVLFSSVTETLGSEEILDDMLDEISTIKRDMNKMKSDLDEMMDTRLDKLLQQVEDLRVIHHAPKTTSATLPPQPSACSSYTELSDAWRHIDYYVSRDELFTYCDKTGSDNSYTNLTVSWYRFTGAAGSKLPTAPAPVGESPGWGKTICGTISVAYISSGGNPTIQDGIVTRDICFEWSDSCLGKTTVQVAACRDMHGDYFVYQLQPVPGICEKAYCASD